MGIEIQEPRRYNLTMLRILIKEEPANIRYSNYSHNQANFNREQTLMRRVLWQSSQMRVKKGINILRAGKSTERISGRG